MTCSQNCSKNQIRTMRMLEMGPTATKTTSCNFWNGSYPINQKVHFIKFNCSHYTAALRGDDAASAAFGSETICPRLPQQDHSTSFWKLLKQSDKLMTVGQNLTFCKSDIHTAPILTAALRGDDAVFAVFAAFGTERIRPRLPQQHCTDWFCKLLKQSDKLTTIGQNITFCKSDIHTAPILTAALRGDDATSSAFGTERIHTRLLQQHFTDWFCILLKNLTSWWQSTIRRYCVGFGFLINQCPIHAFRRLAPLKYNDWWLMLLSPLVFLSLPPF